MSADCALYAYDDDLRLLWHTPLTERRRFRHSADALRFVTSRSKIISAANRDIVFWVDQVLSGVREEGRGASGQKQGWCIRRKAEGPKTETADSIGALKSPFLSVVHGVGRPHHW